MAFELIKRALGATPKDSPETKSVTLTDPAAFELFGAIPTSSGITVSATSALRVPAVACAVGLISETMGSLPASLKDRETKETDDQHPAHKLLHREANPWTSAAQLREQLTLDALLHGSGNALVTRNSAGKPLEIHHLPYGTCQAKRDPDGTPFYLITEESQRQRRVEFFDVLRVEAFGGVSPITLAREAIALALQYEAYLSSTFANGARPSGIITCERRLDVEAKKAIVKNWFSTHGGKNSGSTALLDEGMSFSQIAMTMVDAQFHENRTSQTLEIARAFRVPPSLLFELGRATWSNAEHLMRHFLTLTLQPWIDTWTWGYARCLLTEEERGAYEIKFDHEALLASDHATKATAYSQYRAMGAVTGNEVRDALNLPRIDTPEADTLQNPFTSSQNATPPAETDE